MKTLVLYCLFIVALLAGSLRAQNSYLLSYQGKIVGASGTPIPDGNYPITISLYRSDTATDKSYSQSQDLLLINGKISTTIGSVAELPLAVSFSSPYYFGLSINGAELFPRYILSTTPKAFHSLMARGLTNTAMIPPSLYPPTSAVLFEFGGDLSGTPQTTTVQKIQNRPVDLHSPIHNGDVLQWTGNSWQSGPVPIPIAFHAIDTTVQVLPQQVFTRVAGYNRMKSDIAFDDRNYFSPDDGTFICPESGYYEFGAYGVVSSTNSYFQSVQIGLSIDNIPSDTNEVKIPRSYSNNSMVTYPTYQALIRLLKGQRVSVVIRTSPIARTVTAVVNKMNFYGFRVR